MLEHPLRLMLVVGSLRRQSASRIVLRHLATAFESTGSQVDTLDLAEEPLPLYNPDCAYQHTTFPNLKKRVDQADIFVLGAPDYHGSISSPLKNFLDHFWHEFAGKLFVPIVASHEKGLTATDQLRTVARQCYAWAMPYGVSFMEKADVQEDKIVNAQLEQRLQMLVRDVTVYGRLLATQRQADLSGDEPGFLAKQRQA